MTTELDALRADPARWDVVAFVSVGDEDANEEKRAGLLDRLLTDRRESDVDLLRYLVRQEVLMHTASWGLGDSLRLAALLLSECGHAEDVWLLWTAKRATFDTFSGLDGILLFPAGITGTIAFVERSEHPDRAEVLEYLSEYLTHQPTTERARREHLTGLRDYHR